MSNCELCGQPMPKGEEMFKYHGYSGPCPKPELDMKFSERWLKETAKAEDGVIFSAAAHTEAPAQGPPHNKGNCPSCGMKLVRQELTLPHYVDWCSGCNTWAPVAAPQAESAGKPEPETDLDHLLAICEQNGTKWAHFKVSEIAKLRAELETANQEKYRALNRLHETMQAAESSVTSLTTELERVRLDAKCQVEALGESLVEAKASVTRLTREREEAKKALFDKYKNGEIVELLLARPQHLQELQNAKQRAETAERERDELLQADIKRVQDITRLTLECNGFERERNEAQAWSNKWEGLSAVQYKIVQSLSKSLETLTRERDQAREALRYLLVVRSIKCQHKHPGPDMTCANCKAEAALVPANAEPTKEQAK